MFEWEGTGAAPGAIENCALDTFFFIGGSAIFPNVVLRIVEQEASGVRAYRLNGLSDLQKAVGTEYIVRKVFFDDHSAAEVFRDFGALRSRLPQTDWVLAYRDQSVARRLLEERAMSPQLSTILLLPMTLPIGPWSAMLRLVLANQFVATGELFSAGAGDRPQGLILTGDRQPDQNLLHGDQGPSSEAQGQGVAGPTPQGRRLASRPSLTQREKEVLAMVSEGGRNKSIAHKMSLSEHTVKLHLHNAITKIGARNRTEAANWYLSQLGGDRQ